MKKSVQEDLKVIGDQLVLPNETKRKVSYLKVLYKQRYLLLMSLPITLWMILFSYVPLWGWSLAFFDYQPGVAFSKMQFVGLKFFKELFSDSRFYQVLGNTIIMNLLNVFLACFILPVVFALLLNEVRSIKFKKAIQTVSYLPHFVSWVVVSGMFIHFLSPESGMVNNILMSLHIIKEPINFMAKPDYAYGIITSATIWKELGWNAIIYIASMAGIDQELYEAASVDGAGRLRKIWHVTLPGIRSTIVILLIMNMGSLISGGFDAQFLFSNALNSSKTEVLNIYVLNYGISMLRFSFGTAVGMFTSVISFTLVLLTNKISKKATGESLM